MKRRSILTVSGMAAFALVGGLALGQPSSAQDATPGAMGGTVEAHPGHIHSGTCDELGDVVFPLEDATSGGAMGTPMAAWTRAPWPPPGPAWAARRTAA
jgi:hypothetical protein